MLILRRFILVMLFSADYETVTWFIGWHGWWMMPTDVFLAVMSTEIVVYKEEKESE